MRVKAVPFGQISFNYTSYEPSLYESVQRIGFSFPVKVKYEGEKIVCVDGHKRLSIYQDLNKPQDTRINVIFIDNGDTRSNDSWRRRNIH